MLSILKRYVSTHDILLFFVELELLYIQCSSWIFHVTIYYPPFPFPLFTSFSIADTTKILMFNLSSALDTTTYNWSCENTSFSKCTPTLGTLYPYVLLTVIAMLTWIGNYFSLNWKGSVSLSDEHKGMQGRKTSLKGSVLLSGEHKGMQGRKICFPAYYANTIYVFMVFFWNPHMIILVSLQSLSTGSMFPSNMTGHQS